MANKYFYRIENGARELIGEGEINTFAEIRNANQIVELLCGLRPQVLAFAKLMEEDLRKHDGDRGQRGWADTTDWRLFKGLRDEVQELVSALYIWHAYGKREDAMKVAKEAADVANFAMMIADVAGGLDG